ncbi:MAG: hypothetical protein ACRDGL_07840, partial [Candidatus Limnocylindrales bacterium]
PQPTYAGGIPQAIDGRPVLFGTAIATRIAAATGDTPFLVGGVVSWIDLACIPRPHGSPSPPVNPLLHGCLYPILTPTSANPTGIVNPLSLTSTVSPPLDTPLVLRAHTRDARAAACPSAQRQQCLDALVVEAIVWLGPLPAGPSQAGGFGSDGVPSAFHGEAVPRISAAVLSIPVGTAGCCLVAGWAEGLDAEDAGYLQVADGADASRTWSIDLGPGFEADLHGPIIIDLTSTRPLRGLLVWYGRP